MTHLFFRTFLLAVISSALFASCDTQVTCKFINSQKVANGLYLEWYETCRGGVFAGSCYDYYLTDSASFRALVGQKGDNGMISVALDHNIVRVFTIESRDIDDTTQILEVNLPALVKQHAFDSSAGIAKPLIGPSRLLCGSRLREGTQNCGNRLFLETDQYHCTDRFINAVYLTDSLRFRKLLGMYTDLNWETSYAISVQPEGQLMAFETTSRRVYDTLKTASLQLNELRKESYKPVCEKTAGR